MYNCLKYQILSGGVNHIDSGHHFRWHKAEYTLGKLLSTLFQKYRVERDELFITSKQGYLDLNYKEKAHYNLVIQELISSTSLDETDFVLDSGYCMKP